MPIPIRCNVLQKYLTWIQHKSAHLADLIKQSMTYGMYPNKVGLPANQLLFSPLVACFCVPPA